jgi:hypothetical protein
MRAKIDHPLRIEEQHSSREGLIIVACALFFLALALLLLRVGGWFQVATYLFGVWGVVGLARGLRELVAARRRGRR